MSKTRACFNCLHYTHVPQPVSIHDERTYVTGFSPRCTKGLNPALGDAPDNMALRERGEFQPDEMASFCDSYLWAPPRYPKLRKSATFRLTKEPRFTTVDIAEKFLPFYEQGENMRVKIERGTNIKYHEYGYVSASTGWKPYLLLIRSSKSRGSSVLLTDDDVIVGTKRKDDARYKWRGP